MILDYRPLDVEKNEIRLISIQPPAVREDNRAPETSELEPVQCLLEHVSLD
jgi:hypothetical protein